MAKSITVLAIAMLLGLGVIFTRSSAQQESKSPQPYKQKTDRKAESRKVFKGAGNQYSRKLPEAAAKATGDVKTELEIGLITLNPSSHPTTIYDRLRKRSCDADAIAIATVQSESSFLTEDESFLYTNHQVSIDEVLKDNSASPLQIDNTITVTRRGGAITLNGKKVTAIDKSGLPLQLKKQYLLFLTYLPERGAYVADNLSYQMVNDKIIKTTTGQVYPEEETGSNAAALIALTRNVVSYPCSETQGGPQ